MYIHHIPGRLRVRCASLRDRVEIAPYVKSQLEAQPGVRSAEVNALTGSVKVIYNPALATAKDILRWLQDQGLVPDSVTVPAGRVFTSGPVVNLDGPGGALARKLAGIALEKAVERSVVLLVAALL